MLQSPINAINVFGGVKGISFGGGWLGVSLGKAGVSGICCGGNSGLPGVGGISTGGTGCISFGMSVQF